MHPSFSMPQFTVLGHMAMLLTAVGEPAGSSLTADQWLLMVTVFGPVKECF